MASPCTAEQLLFPSWLPFCELQDGPCRWLVQEFSACQMLWDRKLKIHVCMCVYMIILCDYEQQVKSDKGNVCCWGLLHHYHHQIIFIKLLLYGSCWGLAASHEMKTGLLFSSSPCIQPPTVLPPPQALSLGVLSWFLSWDLNNQCFEGEKECYGQRGVASHAKAPILMKLHSSSDRTRTQLHLSVGLEPTIPDLGGDSHPLSFN